MCASVVASCDTPPVFEFREEVLDLVSIFVCGFAINDCFFAIFLRRNAWCDLPFVQHFADFVTVISAICDQGFCLWQALEQNIGSLEVATLPFR